MKPIIVDNVMYNPKGNPEAVLVVLFRYGKSVLNYFKMKAGTDELWLENEKGTRPYYTPKVIAECRRQVWLLETL